jgi:hypothetical protein
VFLNERVGGGYILRKLEEIERDIYKVQHLLRTLHLERNLLIQTLDNMETSSKVLAQQVIEKMMK